MGKQLNFYMTAKDEGDFVARVRSDRDVVVFKYASPTMEVVKLNVLPSPPEPFWGDLFLWNRELSPTPRLKFIKQQSYYVADEFESEIIQFSRSHFDYDGKQFNKNILVRGRIWAEMRVWQKDGTLLTKSESFQKWFDRLANWIKRRSVRDEAGDYLLPGAAEYQAQGGNLVPAVFADSVKYVQHDP
jgi:hypothetical protein